MGNFDLEKELEEYCEKYNRKIELFDIAKTNDNPLNQAHRLTNRCEVKNKKCTYVIKYFSVLDIIIVWDYGANKSMSYSYDTIVQKLSRGIFYADKGREYHNRNQSTVFFSYSRDFAMLMHTIFNRV